MLLDYRKKSPEKLAAITTPDQERNPQRQHPVIIGDVFIHPSAQVHPTARIGPNVSVGPRAVIGAGVRIKESILLDNVEVKDYSCLLYAIVGWESKIGSWCRIEGTPAYALEPNVSPASNISNVGGNVWTAPTTDLMLPNGIKNASVTIFGMSTISDHVFCMPRTNLL
jgi:NDP-sugar pyrophosphorylase family protein